MRTSTVVPASRQDIINANNINIANIYETIPIEIQNPQVFTFFIYSIGPSLLKFSLDLLFLIALMISFQDTGGLKYIVSKIWCE